MLPVGERLLRTRQRALYISAFAFFGGVPLSILYDNLKIAVVPASVCPVSGRP